MNVLVVAAHPDDEVLGCGGTIARHVAAGDDVHVLYVADGETSRIQAALPNRNLFAQRACECLGVKSWHFLDHLDQRLDQLSLLDIIQEIEAHARQVKPVVVYTHYQKDLNKDHQIVSAATVTAFRSLPGEMVRELYFYEVLSSTEWGHGFSPNYYISLSPADMDKKLQALAFYNEEMRPPPHARSYASVIANAEIRGYSCGVHRAEAFMVGRMIR